MFGHWMEITTETLHLRLGPIAREDMPRFISAEAGLGLQSYEVMKFLGRAVAQTLESEYAWWDKAQADPTIINWGVYLEVGNQWRLIGTTSLKLHEDNSHQATSGFLIFDRAYWRRGIASACHLARTRFGFEEQGLTAIYSHAAVANTGSNRALCSVGYVLTGVHYGGRIVHGLAQDINDYLMPNPAPPFWDMFWNRPAKEIPPEFHQQRNTTRRALLRAKECVIFL